MPKKMRELLLYSMVFISLWLGAINCQTTKISSRSEFDFDIGVKQIEALKGFTEEFIVRPGQVTLLKFPYFGPFKTETLICNGEELPFFRSVDKHLAVAYLAISYFADLKNVDCKFQFRLNGEEENNHELTIGKLVMGEIHYPKEHLNVDAKKVVLSDKDKERVAKERKMLDTIFQQKTNFPLFIEPFNPPLSSKITSVFGTQRIFNGHSASEHLGTDFRAPIGTEVKPANNGRVVFAGDLFFGGNTVVIDHGLGIFTSYMHLNKIEVVVGDMVTKTTLLGVSGNTGRVSGPHLHWGIKVQGHWVDGHSLIDASGKNFPELSIHD